MQESEAEEKEDFESGEGKSTMFHVIRIHLNFLKDCLLSQRLYIAEMIGAILAWLNISIQVRF